MSLPELFERTRRPLGLPEALATTGGPPGLNPAALAGQGRTLNFLMETQTQTQWCWAAVSVSVARFYVPSDEVSQCDVANMELGTDACCASPSACNVDNTLETALDRVGHFRDIAFEPLPFSDVQAEIKAGRPLGCRVGWFGGGGHFVVIHGASVEAAGGSVRRWVAIADPLFGPSDYLLVDFTGGYRQGEGEWTHSYFTR